MEYFQENIKLGEVFVQLLAFLIVFFTLKALAWKPLLKALAARRERIKNDFDRIDDAKREIEALKEEYRLHLQQIDEEARVKIQGAVEEGRRIGREIQDKARMDSQATFDKAKENLELEVAKARIAFRREVAGLAIGAAEKILKEKMAGERAQEEKVLEMIEELEKTL